MDYRVWENDIPYNTRMCLLTAAHDASSPNNAGGIDLSGKAFRVARKLASGEKRTVPASTHQY